MYNKLNTLYRSLDSFNNSHDYNTSKQIRGLDSLYENKIKIKGIPSKNELNGRLTKLIQENLNNPDYLNELYDIQYRHNITINHIFPNNQILNERINTVIKKTNNKITLKDIALDDENVHRTYINESTKKLAILIIEKYKVYPHEINHVLSRIIKSYNNDKKIVQVIETFKECNSTTFGGSINLIILLCSIWKCIEQHKDIFNDVKIRLYDELVDSENVCPTGKLSRSLNSLQGFEFKDFNVSDYFNKEKFLHDVIYRFINRELKDCTDEDVMEGILIEVATDEEQDLKRKKAITYVTNLVLDQINNWINEYDVDDVTINNIVNKYLNLPTD